jgi:hypothetical protein
MTEQLPDIIFRHAKESSITKHVLLPSLSIDNKKENKLRGVYRRYLEIGKLRAEL